jgi:hypothetical protein
MPLLITYANLKVYMYIDMQITECNGSILEIISGSASTNDIIWL